MESKKLFLTVMIMAVLCWAPAAKALCPAPDSVASVTNVGAYYNEGAELPIEVWAEITNISDVPRDIKFAVHIHGHLVDPAEGGFSHTGFLDPGETFFYYYKGERPNWMDGNDGFPYRVVITVPQSNGFKAKNPARGDGILKMPVISESDVVTEVNRAQYLGHYLVDIKSTIRNTTDNPIQPGWTISIMNVPIYQVEHVALGPHESKTYHETIDLNHFTKPEDPDGFDPGFFDDWGPYPIRVVSGSAGFRSYGFFRPNDLCHCKPEVCGDGIDNDCNGYVDDNCDPVEDTVSKNFCHDLEWQKTGHNGQFTIYLATDYCASLGDGWRLPAKDELKSIVACPDGPETPLDDGVRCNGWDSWPHPPYCSEEFNCMYSKYWTSTPAGDGTYWMVDFYTGASETVDPKTTTGNVRCVREQ